MMRAISTSIFILREFIVGGWLSSLGVAAKGRLPFVPSYAGRITAYTRILANRFRCRDVAVVSLIAQVTQDDGNESVPTSRHRLIN
jgi:hypothetical protein